MNSVEQKYYQAIQQMSGIEKMKRVFSLYHFAHQMIENQVSKKEPNLSEQEKKIRIAERMYSSDKPAMELLNKWKRQLGMQI